MSIAAHVGREVQLVALGRTWRVGRWTRQVWADFLAWARPRLADPLDVAAKAIEKFPAHLHDVIVRHAIDRSQTHLTAGSIEVQQLLGTIEGSMHLLWLLLRQNHPDVSEDDAFEIATEVGSKTLEQAFNIAAGKVPASAEGNEPAPVA